MSTISYRIKVIGGIFVVCVWLLLCAHHLDRIADALQKIADKLPP